MLIGVVSTICACTLSFLHVLQLAPTHVCVTFDDGSPSVVPTKNLVNQSNVKVNDVCEVRWTDGKVYTARIVAIGKTFLSLPFHFDYYYPTGGRDKMEKILAEKEEGKPALSLCDLHIMRIHEQKWSLERVKRKSQK